jgi:hypothetical protein
VNVCPAMVIVPDRAAPGFAATLYCTAPLPEPVAPDVIVIHDALLVAVQPQPEAAETDTLPLPAFSLNALLCGLIEYEQGAAWVTVNV